MKWLLAIVGIILSLGITIWLIGRLLPLHHRASVSRSIPAPPDEVWSRISNVDRWRSWRKDIKSLTRVSEDQVDVTDKFGSARYRIERPGGRTLVTVIDQEGLPYGGSWTWVVEPDGENASLVTITEEGEIYSPFFRFMARFVFGYEATMRSILDQLERSFAASEGARN